MFRVPLAAVLASAATVGALVGLSTSAAVADTVAGDRLMAGQVLDTGQSIQSDNGYALAMQTDGNLVVYSPTGQAQFATNTSGAGAYLALQTDGNLVVYSAGRPLWANGARGNDAVLVMQSDGNAVEYVAGAPVWASKTPPPPPVTDTLSIGGQLGSGQKLVANGGAYQFVMQTDGNAVLYGPSGVRYATNTGGHPGAFLVMQGDGNAVVYGPSALWQSFTAGRGGNRLVMQGDGNLVLYSNAGAALFVAPAPVSSAPPPPPPTPPQQGITPGAYCSTPGAYGYSKTGVLYVCANNNGYRWTRV